MPDIDTDILKDLPTQTYAKRPEYVKAFFFSRQMAEDYLFDGKPLPKGIRLCRADWYSVHRTIRLATFSYKLPSGEWSGEFTPDVWIIADDHNFWTYSPEAFANAFTAEVPTSKAAEERIDGIVTRAIRRRDIATDEQIVEALDAFVGGSPSATQLALLASLYAHMVLTPSAVEQKYGVAPGQCTCQGRDNDPPILNDILCPIHSALVNSPPEGP